MQPIRKLSRRSFFGRVGGGIVAGGALGAVSGLGGSARAQSSDTDQHDLPGLGTRSGITDSDTGPRGDPIGNGRGANRPSGCGDTDAGDPRGNGRSCRQFPQDPYDSSDRQPRHTGITDNDRGSPYADMEGRGRGTARNPPPSGWTDHDPTDRSGHGRGGAGGPPYTGHTDADPGDRAGYGRGGARRCTDADTGEYADPAGSGRYCPR